MKALLRIAILGTVLGSTVDLSCGEFRFSGYLAGEARGFFQNPVLPGQSGNSDVSLVTSPELRWTKGRHRFVVVPFARLDSADSERTHFDLREAYWLIIGEDWEIQIGFDRVFWGVAESRHLVDVINQTDLVENIDGEDKLGQMMIRLGLQRDWGSLSFFALPGFRQRTFPGEEGRFRFPLPVDTDGAIFEGSAGRRHVDYAVRYSHFFGDWDIGVAYFHGTGREPRLVLSEDGESLVPVYSIIDQFSADVQYTRGAWLWKLEQIVHRGQGRTFAAIVAGFEYTLYHLVRAADVGLLFEYLRDGRDEDAPTTIYDDDLFVGARLALNDIQDTSLLAGAVIDRSSKAAAVSVEFERRLGDQWTLELEGRLFLNASSDRVLNSFARDDSMTLRLSWHF